MEKINVKDISVLIWGWYFNIMWYHRLVIKHYIRINLTLTCKYPIVAPPAQNYLQIYNLSFTE